jgi:protein required for attachment to host cells
MEEQKMETTWIMVASRDEVRIFSRMGRGQIKLERDIGNPLGRLKNQDLESDKAGAPNDNRIWGRPAYSSEESAKERALKDFYREVCDQIDHALSTHQFERLILIAEPRLLGYIRGILSKNVQRAVCQTIPKDLSAERDQEIESRL